ncbi:YdcF family protein [Chromatocurvus halotolerans]|uniref:DUF218 domain-containing protein n=1 Tax=Chromatocurvus halotolerans TaxID=1132028 RepID=A0A4R2KSA4_9GAMM|nr:YdcF family protein [Chromatocurvus halotolerans]TCO76653.1 DUF218 domain-containing protein [Chromatocurvus halotolerans]
MPLKTGKYRLAAGLWCLAVAACVSAMDPPGYKTPYHETLASLNFPLLPMIHETDDLASLLRNDTSLAALADDRTARVIAAPECTEKPACLADAWLWTEADIATVDAALRRAVSQSQSARALVARQMRPSGRFARHEALSDEGLITAAWSDTVAGINNIISVYAKGQPPRYPLIDSMIFDPEDQGFAASLNAHGQVVASGMRDTDLVFDSSARFATGLLRMNERMDASNLRPVFGGTNAGAVRAVGTVDWEDYPYTAMLVFGHGPEDAQSRTGPMSYIRMARAVDLFERRLAPFIVVSGGNVHPDRTPFNEALEMRRILIEQHYIPAERILIEPHARHTTTNLRNSARLLFAAGFPADRPSLIVTDPMTAGYIGSERLMERTLDETGIVPGLVTSSDTPFAFEFIPHPAAFHVEALDPLDP